MKGKLLKAIEGFKDAKILVVGDIILDEYVYGTVDRISPEAPVPVFKKIFQTKYALGGAANVAHNVVKMGGQVILIGIIGTDQAADTCIQYLRHAHIPEDIMATEQITTKKTRLIDDRTRQQILRLDSETYHDRGSAKLVSRIKMRFDQYDVALISDYDKGVVSKDVLDAVANCKYTIVDPKKDFSEYYELNAITPNKKEALKWHFEDFTGTFDWVLVTEGEEGMTLFNSDIKRIPSHAKDIYDVTGAGDTVLASMGLGIAVGLTPYESAILANIAAGIAVGKHGTYAVKREELIKEIIELDESQNLH